MKINAIIEKRDGGTLVLDFPRSIYDVYEKLQSVGIRQSPHQITLSDEEDDDVRIKLYLGTQIANTIFDAILQWFYEIIYGAVADFFTMMGNMGAEIFDLSWVLLSGFSRCLDGRCSLLERLSPFLMWQ